MALHGMNGPEEEALVDDYLDPSGAAPGGRRHTLAGGRTGLAGGRTVNMEECRPWLVVDEVA